MTSDEVIYCIEYIVNYISPRFVFYPYDLDDIKQHARMLALEAIAGFDPQSKKSTGTPEERLRAFLFHHIKMRLINLQRDKRGNKEEKKNLTQAGSIYGLDESNETYISFENDIDQYDISVMKAKILEELDVDLRHTYHKVLANLSVPKNDRDHLMKRIKEILGVKEEEYAEEV